MYATLTGAVVVASAGHVGAGSGGPGAGVGQVILGCRLRGVLVACISQGLCQEDVQKIVPDSV